MNIAVTAFDKGLVDKGGRIIRATSSRPLYRATTTLDGQEYAAIDTSKDAAIEELKSHLEQREDN